MSGGDDKKNHRGVCKDLCEKILVAMHSKHLRLPGSDFSRKLEATIDDLNLHVLEASEVRSRHRFIALLAVSVHPPRQSRSCVQDARGRLPKNACALSTHGRLVRAAGRESLSLRQDAPSAAPPARGRGQPKPHHQGATTGALSLTRDA
jgi:hypothetical protein